MSKKTNTVLIFRVYHAIDELTAGLNDVNLPREFKAVLDYINFRLAERPAEPDRVLLEAIHSSIIKRLESING